VAIDLGTGTGQSVLRLARAEPQTLVIGIDPDAVALREASHSAARAPKKGGLPNAIFLAGSAEELPGALARRADLLTVALPWGSLLRAFVTPEPDAIARIAQVLKPRGEIELLLSTVEADGAPRLLASEREADDLARAYESAGLCVAEVRPAIAADVARMSSAWGRRLGIPERRQAWIYRLGNESGESGVRAHPEEAIEIGAR
jgi:16S rRNA (adenine(1408)-N(1))-methyltransferase